MQARNHIPFAMSCWWLYCLITGLPIVVHGTMAAAIGGLLPDLDHPDSALGRRLRLISVPLSALVGHRGVTHSLIAVVIVITGAIALPGLPLPVYLQGLLLPLLIGYLSHLAGDAMTPSGVPLLWPHKRRFSLNLFTTWSWQESAFVGVFTLGIVVFGGVAQQVVKDFIQQLQILATG